MTYLIVYRIFQNFLLKVIVDASDKVVVLNMLNNLEKWQNLWLLKFNPAKCKVMHIPFNGNPMHDYTFIVYTCTQVFTVILKGLPGRF